MAQGQGHAKYFLCRMVYIFFVQSWYFIYLHGMANSRFWLQICDISWETMKVQKWKYCVTPDSNPHPMDLCCAFWITTAPHSWLHEVRYICSKCVLVKCLYQSLYPWAKYLTQPWSVTRWMKDNIGMKGIIVMKISFHFVLHYHVNERILPTIPAFVLGKYSQCMITHTGKCWDMVVILHNIPSFDTGKAWEISLVSDQTFCTGTSHLHNSSNFPVNSQQFLTIPSVWSDTGKI